MYLCVVCVVCVCMCVVSVWCVSVCVVCLWWVYVGGGGCVCVVVVCFCVCGGCVSYVFLSVWWLCVCYFLFNGFVIHLWHRLANGCILGRAYLSFCPVVCFVYEMMDFHDI